MFPPQNQPGAQVTGNENDFEQFVRDTVAQKLEERMSQSNSQTPAASPIKVTLAGQTATFANETELNSWLVDYNARMAAQIAAAQTQAAPKEPVVATQQPGGSVTGNESQDYNLDRFVDRLTKDRPGAALLDALNAEGVDLKAIAEAVKSQQLLVNQQSEVMAAARFKETFSDFPANPAAAQKLNALRQQLNQPFTFEGLAATYALADRMGQFSEFRQQQGQQFAGNQYQPQYQPNGYNPVFQPAQAPPRAGRSGAAEPPADVMQMADQLSIEQLEQMFSDFGRR